MRASSEIERRLVDFLAPSLGGQPSSPGFTLALPILFATSGFLALYIFTRVYVGVLFAHTEMSLGAFVAQKSEELSVRRTMRMFTRVHSSADSSIRSRARSRSARRSSTKPSPPPPP